jgi:hypothetical protein
MCVLFHFVYFTRFGMNLKTFIVVKVANPLVNENQLLWTYEFTKNKLDSLTINSLIAEIFN